MTVEISAVLKNGVATTIIINDKNPNPAKNPGNPGNQTFEYTPEVTQRGNFLDVKANTNVPNGVEVWSGAYNWLSNNGYNVVNATATGSNWQFYATRNGQNYVFTTNLITMVKVVIDGTTGFYQANVALALNGDYFQWGAVGSARPVAGTIGTDTAAVTSTGWTPTWTNNGSIELWTGLYKVTLDHDGTSGSGTDLYYKMGEEIKAGTSANDLQGNWYALSAKGNSDSTVADFTSTKDVVMTNALKDQTIYDNYYHVQAVANLGGTHDAVNEYVLGGQDSSELGVAGVASLYAKSSDGNYVVLSAAQKITAVNADYDIIDAGYALVNEIVTVTDTSVTTQLNGITILATVAPETFVKANEGSITVKLSLAANTNKTTGKIDLGAVTLNSETTEYTASDMELIDNNGSTLEVTEVTFKVPASLGTVSGGKVTVVITPIVGS